MTFQKRHWRLLSVSDSSPPQMFCASSWQSTERQLWQQRLAFPLHGHDYDVLALRQQGEKESLSSGIRRQLRYLCVLSAKRMRTGRRRGFVCLSSAPVDVCGKGVV